MIQTLIALLIPFLLGFLAVSLILREQSSLLERLSLAYPAGAGLLTIQVFILGILKIPLELLYILPVLFIEILTMLYFYPKIRSKEDLQMKLWMAPLLLIILIKIISIFLETYLRPVYAWDAWVNWSMGAKLFYYNKGLLLDDPEHLLGKGYGARIISYPLHNPLMQVWIALFTGDFDEVLVKFWSPLYLLSITAYLYIILNRELGGIIAALVVIIFLSSPLLCYHSIEVYSDLCLGAYIFLIIASFYQLIKGKEKFVFLLSLFSAESLFVKDEAIFFIIPAMVSALIYLKKKKPLRYLFIAFIPFTYILPWFFFKFINKLSIGAEYIEWQFTFQPHVLKSVLLEILSLQNFNIVFIAFPVLMLLETGKKYIYLLLPVLSYFIFFISLYMFTSFYYDHFMKGTVFFRNMLTLYPSVTFLSGLYIKDLIAVPSQ